MNRPANALTAAVASLAAAAVLLSAPAPADVLATPKTGPDAAPWQSAFPARPATYEVEKRSLYVPMTDGVKLAVDVYLPKGLAGGARVPTLLVQTRYYRAFDLKADPANCSKVSKFPAYFAAHGYALVYADVRGTGASFGVHQAELGAEEIADGGTLLDWITAQPWSSGKVGALGQSYLGSTAELLQTTHRPALKAVAPVSATFDAYADLYFPGGILNTTFKSVWGALNLALDSGHPERVERLAGVVAPCPVDADPDGTLRAAAIAGHAANFDSGAAMAIVTFRDDPDWVRSHTEAFIAQSRSDPDRVPFLSIEATMDSGYARSGVDRLINSTSPQQRLILAAGAHGAHAFYAPGVTSLTPSAFDQNAELLAFMDHYVDGQDNGYEAQPKVRWFTTGANAWHGADAWPKPAEFDRFCFAEGRRLEHGCTKPGRERFVPTDADGDTGPRSRWNTTSDAGPVFYAERTAVDAKLLAYTSEPLQASLETTGSPVVTLKVTDTAPEGDYFVYLEEVDEAGLAYIVGEGELRASKAAGEPPYKVTAPMPSGLRRDQRGSLAGKPLTLQIAMTPLSHRFAKGSRIRVSIAGSDRAHFDSGHSSDRRWTVRIGKAGSELQLPIVK